MDKLEVIVDRLLSEAAKQPHTMAPTHVIRELRREIMLDPSLLESLGVERVS